MTARWGARPGAVPIVDLSVRVCRREVLRYLGYPRGGQPAAHVAPVIDGMLSAARALVEPRGCYRLVSSDAISAAEMPEPTDPVGVGLCTIGPELEAEAERLSSGGKVLEALVLDACGSAAAEAAAESLDRRLCAAAHARGYHSRVRISPGYGRWNMRHQQALLALLPASSLRIELTAAMMMLPRKSVSFAVRLFNEARAGARERRRCALCEMRDCAFRLQPDDDS